VTGLVTLLTTTTATRHTTRTRCDVTRLRPPLLLLFTALCRSQVITCWSLSAIGRSESLLRLMATSPRRRRRTWDCCLRTRRRRLCPPLGFWKGEMRVGAAGKDRVGKRDGRRAMAVFHLRMVSPLPCKSVGSLCTLNLSDRMLLVTQMLL
jgi:hypothetical protein